MKIGHNYDSNGGFHIAQAINGGVQLVKYACKDDNQLHEVDRRSITTKTVALMVQDSERKVEIAQMDEHFAMCIFPVRQNEFLMVEDVEGEPVEKDRMFIYLSERRSNRFVLSSELPSWVENDDNHFLTKFGKLAETVPAVRMTTDECLAEALAAAQGSLKSPFSTLEGAILDHEEELLDRHVVVEDEPLNITGPDGYPDEEATKKEFEKLFHNFSAFHSACVSLVIGDKLKRETFDVDAWAAAQEDDSDEDNLDEDDSDEDDLNGDDPNGDDPNSNSSNEATNTISKP